MKVIVKKYIGEKNAYTHYPSIIRVEVDGFEISEVEEVLRIIKEALKK